MEPAELVDAALSLDAEIKARAEKLTAIKQQLVDLGPGNYAGTKGKAVVIHPAPSLKPSADTIEEAQSSLESAHFCKLFEKNVSFVPTKDGIEFARENLDKSVFKKIFERVTRFSPVKGFREVAKALLPPKKADALVANCEVENTAYVKLSAG